MLKHVERRLQGQASGKTVKMMRLQYERYYAHALAKIEKEIRPVLDRIGRRIDLSKYRPRRMTRPEIHRAVAKEYQDKGRPEITPRRVKAFWTEYGNFLKALNET